MIEITQEMKTTYIETAKVLRGDERRIFMARIVKMLGRGGQSYAEREFGWNRRTIRKGTHEVESGVRCIDNFRARGRKRAEEHLPNLLADISSIVDSQSQTDPTFRTMRLYTRLSVVEVRRQLIEQKGYCDAELPSLSTLNVKLKALGYHLRSVQKSRPQKNG